MQLYYIHNI